MYLVFILFACASIFLSQNPLAGWYWLLKFLEMSFLVWYVVNLGLSFPRKRESSVMGPGSPSGMTVIGMLLSLTVIFESILAILQTIHHGSLGGIFYLLGERTFNGSTPGIANASVLGQLILRPYGTFSHPNVLAGYLIVGMLLVLYFYSKVRSTPEVEGPNTSGVSILRLYAVFAIGFLALLLTLSRVAIIIWIIAGAVLFFYTKERSRRSLLFVALGVATLILLLFVFFPQVISRFAFSTMDESVIVREQLARSAISMTITHPLFGVGPNNFISSLPYFSKNSFVLQPVHSIYLLIAAELGIPGLTIFLGFLSVVFKRLLYQWKKDTADKKRYLLPLSLALFAILFSGFFDHYWTTLQQGQLLFAVVIGLILRETRTLHDTIRK